MSTKLIIGIVVILVAIIFILVVYYVLAHHVDGMSTLFGSS